MSSASPPMADVRIIDPSKTMDLYLHQQGLDTMTPSGKAMFQMMAVLAELEHGQLYARHAKKSPTLRWGVETWSSCEPRFKSRRGISPCAGASPIAGSDPKSNWSNICRRS
jgi:hypothetical protein